MTVTVGDAILFLQYLLESAKSLNYYYYLILLPILILYIEYILTKGCLKGKQSYNNKHVVITGGSSGIGLALAGEFLKLHANVTLLARDYDNLIKAQSNLAKQIIDDGHFDNNNINNLADIITNRINIICCDVTKPNLVRQSIENAIKKFGNIKVVICAAGLSIPGYFPELELIDFHTQMDVNYFGIVNTVRAVLPHLLENKGKDRCSQIVMVGSVASVVGIFGYTAYCPTKWAVRGFCDSLRAELFNTNISLSMAYPPDTNTPGFRREVNTKPAEQIQMYNPKDAFSSEEVASCLIDGIAKKLYHLPVPGDFFSGLVVDYMAGVSPRASILLSAILCPIIYWGTIIYLKVSDFVYKDYAKKLFSENNNISIRKSLHK